MASVPYLRNTAPLPCGPSRAIRLLIVLLMHKRLGTILPQPLHALSAILVRMACGIHMALSSPFIQLYLAWPTVAPRLRWSLIPPTLPYQCDFVPRCLVPRAPLIQ